MAETDDHPTEILLSRARLYVARYTDSTPAAERLILDKLADERLGRWLYHQARIEGGPAPKTLHHLSVQLAAMRRLPDTTELNAWDARAIRKCFWLRPEPDETLEVYWEQSRAVRVSPPLILVPDGAGGSYPVQFPNYPVMTIEVDIVRLLRTELDAMLRRAGLMAPLAAPPSPPSSPPPSPPSSPSSSPPPHGTTERWVYDEMEKDPPRRGDRKYVDHLWRRRLDKGIEKGTIKNYVGKYRKQFEMPE